MIPPRRRKKQQSRRARMSGSLSCKGRSTARRRGIGLHRKAIGIHRKASWILCTRARGEEGLAR
eukprot:9340248-Alexandrium_andersonii.AAC.1